ILNTGPTGSGKTTTLYACLKRVNDPSTKIITIEDPIEYRLPGISQTQVHKERGYDFSSGLRAIVRQDPDVILVGEIRDEETADIAVHAALTGHLVFSTVHANSAAGAVPRLVDLGIRPSLITPSINAIIAQRLVRKLCPHCKEEYIPAGETLDTMNKFLSIISPKAELEIPKNIKTLYRPTGCPKCRGLGYKGRLGIFEIFEINKEIEKLILDMAPDSDLLAAAMENGMITMLQDGILKAVAGETSMEEVQRVTGSGDVLEQAYERIMRQLLSMQLFIRNAQIKKITQGGFDTKALEALFHQASSKELLEYVVAGGLFFDAGDIHLEPVGDVVKIRYRIDEILQDIGTISAPDYMSALSKIKTLAGFKAGSHEAVRDGRFGIKLESALPGLENTEIDVRASIITGGYGETTVMRLLHKSAKSLDIEKIGIRKEILGRLIEEVEKPNGIILNTGPTGSGKTTTLYSLLNRLNKPEVKIITVEDPIEYRLKGILQTQVNAEEGYDFSSALRALLRQNPDILMIGEIRDEETAKIAVQASLTGHLVLSTLHTNNAVASVQRLINMNIDPSDIASATNCLMAQRLVRKLCPDCKKAVKPDQEKMKKITETLEAIPKNSGIAVPGKVEQIFDPVGCKKCKGLGYRGLLPVAEVMTMSEEMEELVSRFSTTSAILRQAAKEGMVTMGQDGILWVIEGITSLAEVERVTEK
ncbi:GspE/PulE family protein, partial [Patescibacteria group bacterium]|nr:GspE/PulE family protein [Patescibacteria group bacterium]